MEEYIIAIFITLFLAYFIKESQTISYPGEINHKKIVLRSSEKQILLKFLCFFPLFFLSAFRYGVGTDYFITYYDGFLRVLHHNDFDRFEIGYKALCQVIGRFTSNPQWVFIITAFLFSFFTFLAIYENSADVFFSVFLLVFTRNYFMSMNGVRQFVGMAIILYAIKYILNKDYKMYLVFFAIASLIHYSMIICIVFIFADKIKLNKYIFFIAFAVVASFRFFLGEKYINALIRSLMPVQKFIRHLENKGLYAGTNFAIVMFLINLTIFIIFYRMYKDFSWNLKYKFYLNIQAITVFICIMMTVVPLVERVYYIFAFTQILSVPYVVNLYHGNMKKVLKIGIATVFFIICIYDIFIKGDHEVVPYMSVFENV